MSMLHYFLNDPRIHNLYHICWLFQFQIKLQPMIYMYMYLELLYASILDFYVVKCRFFFAGKHGMIQRT